ncbi:hypothetical protein HBN50_14230 [Halobacteriovorax sp. GB3]|uniref:hypothetical protein n=1 Tax=Halobacteriovorax sp. GB3 TaxID=2719615 RepID=UPI002360D85E|nr:hypothetical protein [Halobacteriovorax sp. GB3]MDD0854267.1 hypothetical protein [Halobacteriovorax sp. GB3]
MKLFKRPVLLIVILLVITVSVNLVTMLIQGQSDSEREQLWQAEASRSFLEFARKSQLIWLSGQSSNAKVKDELICPVFEKIKDVDDSFYQCNPDYFSCYLNSKKEFVENGAKISFKSEEGVRYLYSNDPLNSTSRLEFLFLFNLEKENKTITRPLYFEKSCHEVFLPQRIYGYGNPKEQKIWDWDNFNQKIFIDKFQVTNYEVNKWIETSALAKKLKVKKNDGNPAASALYLTKSEMDAYCMEQGKQVLSAKVYDAAVFHPGDYENKRPTILNRSRFPWTRSNLKSFVFKAWANKKKDFTKDECSKLYAKDCKSVTSYIHHSTLSNSWSGIYQVMGGPFEYLENKIDPKKNIRLSSIHFPLSSRVHQIGIRGYWSGASHNIQEFDFGKYEKDFENKERVGVAFRCMRMINE